MRALPTPMHAVGNINLLWQHVNIPEKSQSLVLAWILDCFIPNTAFPILVLTGQQGSGKSSTQNKLRDLIDPSTQNLRNAPKHVDDIPVAAANNWLVSYNNVSKLSNDNQDDFCCLSTGGGFSKRRLFSDNDEIVLSIKRPVILNGIGDLISRQDLLDRAVIVELPVVDRLSRKTDALLDENFSKNYSIIFSGLLDALVMTLKALPTVHLSSKPRMADFALLGAALERSGIVNEGEFLDQYRKNYYDNMVSSLQASTVAMALINFMKDRPYISCNYAGLLSALKDSNYCRHASDWPTSPRGLASTLKRLVPALNLIGLGLSFDTKPRNDGYHVEVFKIKTKDE
jgi:hypothetical protein